MKKDNPLISQLDNFWTEQRKDAPKAYMSPSKITATSQLPKVITKSYMYSVHGFIIILLSNKCNIY